MQRMARFAIATVKSLAYNNIEAESEFSPATHNSNKNLHYAHNNGLVWVASVINSDDLPHGVASKKRCRSELTEFFHSR